MLVGTPTEIKNAEKRVGLTPASARELVAHGHDVIIQAGAGLGIGATDDDYRAGGARMIDNAAELFAQADMIVKVKEPQPSERAMLREGQILFTYLHLAPDPDQTRDLVASGATCIAYETVTDERGGLPLLAPMSQVAGRMSVQAGAHALESAQGGAGVLLGGVPGVHSGQVVVIGGGVVGENAIEMAVGLGALVTVLDRSIAALDRLSHRFGASLETIYSTRTAVEDLVAAADLVIGAVLVKGSRARSSSPGRCWPRCGPVPCWSTWPSTRAAASRRRTPPPTPNPPSWSTASCTTAWPTCPVRCPVPRPMP